MSQIATGFELRLEQLLELRKPRKRAARRRPTAAPERCGACFGTGLNVYGDLRGYCRVCDGTGYTRSGR